MNGIEKSCIDVFCAGDHAATVDFSAADVCDCERMYEGGGFHTKTGHGACVTQY